KRLAHAGRHRLVLCACSLDRYRACGGETRGLPIATRFLCPARARTLNHRLCASCANRYFHRVTERLRTQRHRPLFAGHGSMSSTGGGFPCLHRSSFRARSHSGAVEPALGIPGHGTLPAQFGVARSSTGLPNPFGGCVRGRARWDSLSSCRAGSID
ncbi:hypothetical protein B0H13DRAFT_2025446, partial [Mycena leptocephala]